MNRDVKDITLKIVARQMVDGMEDEQVIEFMTEGKLNEEEGALRLLYDESEMSGMPGCKTELTIMPDMVSMERTGGDIELDTAIEFRKGQRYEGFYETPFGTVEMEVLTNDLINNLDSEGRGNIKIDYHVSLKGLSDGRSILDIEILQ